jgi:hypothetical protein
VHQLVHWSDFSNFWDFILRINCPVGEISLFFRISSCASIGPLELFPFGGEFPIILLGFQYDASISPFKQFSFGGEFPNF